MSGKNQWWAWMWALVKLLLTFRQKIVEQRLADFPESEKEAIRTIPLSFKIEVEPIENEAETENNQLTFSIDASRENQMLIVDNRPRWETRYLNNLFERDDRWEVACVWETRFG